MSKKKSSGNSFLVQGSILAMASIISRIIGMIYRIPMTHTIGDDGNNYYSTAFEIYNILLIISSYSLPLAVSKLVSAQKGRGKRHRIAQILKGAFLIAGAGGLITAVILFFGANAFAHMLETPESYYAIRVLAPALFIVAILGVMRGFFQGMGTMVPSAISQVLEQIVNAIVSVWAAYVLYRVGSKAGAVLGRSDQLESGYSKLGSAYGAAGGTIGTVSGSVISLLFVGFLFAIYMIVFKRQMKKEKNVQVDSFAYTLKILFVTIIPVLLSTTVYNIGGFIQMYLFKNIATAQGYGAEQIAVWWGVYTGKYKLLVNVPIAISSAMAASSVPAITRSFTDGDYESVRDKLRATTRLVMIIAYPCTIGLGVLARPIMQMLFPGQTTVGMAAMMMYVGCISVIFYSLSTLSNGLLQGIDRMSIPVINAVISLVLHAILLVAMMVFFRMNIYAVIFANMFFGVLMCFLNQIALAKYSGYRHEWKKSFILPAICSLIMGAVTLGFYYLVYLVIKSNTVACLFAIVIAVFVYFVLLILSKAVDEDDLLSFPKGTLLVKAAKKLRLIR